ncbi:hypothetical protein [Rossellomorea aquimaris]|uniref:hypothetical protein n=1 Tax=Rossellomorea aquimaris TaxID=189382 RepID=UPI0007D069A5|nr:hypothetical protein [Rossellomorea aquimaris]
MLSNSYESLLKAYSQLWKNRFLVDSDSISAEEVIKEAIKRDLSDENSHPRARKSKDRKFILATNRIINSDLTNDVKVALVNLHIQLLYQLEE